MATWIEHFIDANIRILGVLDDRPRRGRPSLTYRIEARGQPIAGDFVSFDAALAAATQLAQQDAA